MTTKTKRIEQKDMVVKYLKNAEVKNSVDYIRILLANNAIKELIAQGVAVPDVIYFDTEQELELKSWEKTAYTGDGWKMYINFNSFKKSMYGREVEVHKYRKLILVESAHKDKIHDYYLVKLL